MNKHTEGQGQEKDGVDLGKTFQTDSVANAITSLGQLGQPEIGGLPSGNSRLSLGQLDLLYISDDIARKVVDELPEDAFKGGWEVTKKRKKTAKSSTKRASGDEIEADARLRVTKKLLQAAKWGRLHGAGACMIVTDKVSGLEEPVIPGKEEVLALLPLSIYEFSEWEYARDPRSEYFGECEVYSVHPKDHAPMIGADQASYSKVHRSRMLIFEGNEIPPYLSSQNLGFKDSVLQVSWPAIRDFKEFEMAVSRIVAGFEQDIYSIAGLGSVLGTTGGADALLQRMRLIQMTKSIANAVVLDTDAGESFTRNFANLAGLDVLWDRKALSVARAASMSMTQLFGVVTTGLSSEDGAGRANWRKRVSGWQKDQLVPNLIKLYTLISGGEEVEVRISVEDELTEMDEADIMAKKATARQLMMQALVPGGEPLLLLPEMKETFIREGLLPPDFNYTPPPVYNEGSDQGKGYSPLQPSPEEQERLAAENAAKNKTSTAQMSGVAGRTQ